MESDSRLENIEGNLLAYQLLVPGTFQHSDELTIGRRTDHELRKFSFYTGDLNLFHLDDKGGREEVLWGIAREPQNLILQNLDEASQAFKQLGNYFPDHTEAHEVFWREDTVRTDVRGLELIGNIPGHHYFKIDPRNIKKLNSQQKLAAQRMYGSDEENFGKNMEMFAEEEIIPLISVPDLSYIKDTLLKSSRAYFARASWLNNFDSESLFYTNVRNINYLIRVRGVRRSASVSEQEVPAGYSAHGKSLQGQKTTPPKTYEQILAIAEPLVAPSLWTEFSSIIPVRAPVYGDVLQRTVDGKYMSQHSLEQFIKEMEK